MPEKSTTFPTEMPGYKVYTCNTAAQEGRQVLRVIRLEMREIRHMARWQEKWAAALERGDEAALAEVYNDLASMVPTWNFVGRNGESLPQPEQDSGVFDRLDMDTLFWLMGNGEGQLFEDLLPKKA